MQLLARAAAAIAAAPALLILPRIASSEQAARHCQWAFSSSSVVRRTFSTSPIPRLQPPKSHEAKPESNTDVTHPLEPHLAPGHKATITVPSPAAASHPTERCSSTSATQDDAGRVETNARSSEPTSSSSTTASLTNALTTNLPRLLDTMQARMLTASQTLNDLTGYSDIERIKIQNDRLESRLQAAHETLRQARTTYKTTTSHRSTTQRDVNTLLARKETWSPPDVERFTELYRRDHTLEQEVVAAAERLNEAEADEQRLSQELMAGMLRRYHEEQIWSDRIRRASTWGTWGLMGVNVVMFVLLQFVAEPWRRRRLVRAVVEEEKDVLESVREELTAVREFLSTSVPPKTGPHVPGVEAVVVASPKENIPASPTEANDSRDTMVGVDVPIVQGEPLDPAATWAELLSDPQQWRAKAADLYSERRVDMSMRDASLIVLQAAAVGAATASTLAFIMLKKT